jgi:5-(carboxyamino)imidazole ribonucleotide mutase
MEAFQVELQGQAESKGERLRAHTASRPKIGFSL